MNSDLKYFYEEVAEEGELYIAFTHLSTAYEWSLERFRDEVERASAEGACSLLSRRDGAEETRVSVDKIDFSSPDGLLFLSFDPSPVAWDFYNKYI